MEKFKFYAFWLSLLCIIVYLLQTILDGFTGLFMLDSSSLAQPWRFVTAIFLHANIGHLIYNLVALLLFGFILEKIVGWKKFLLLFFVSGILANIISFPFYPNALGASGAIIGLIGCLAVLRPMMIVWAFGVILPMFLVAIAWILGSILGIFGFGDQSTGYLAHLSGIFVGILYGMFLRLQIKKQKENSTYTIYNRKIVIPEDSMRRWENYYMKG